MRPGDAPGLAAQAATAATLRKATLGPYDVIVLAAVEAVNHEPGRQIPASREEIAKAAGMVPGQVILSMGLLERQRLVSGDGAYWALTPLGVEVLGELIRRETRRRGR